MTHDFDTNVLLLIQDATLLIQDIMLLIHDDVSVDSF